MQKAGTPTRSEDEIMQDIHDCYLDLSGENLEGDGEYSASKIARDRRAIETRLRKLFKEIGRQVDEAESSAWFLREYFPAQWQEWKRGQ